VRRRKREERRGEEEERRSTSLALGELPPQLVLQQQQFGEDLRHRHVEVG